MCIYATAFFFRVHDFSSDSQRDQDPIKAQKHLKIFPFSFADLGKFKKLYSYVVLKAIGIILEYFSYIKKGNVTSHETQCTTPSHCHVNYYGLSTADI